MNLKTNDYTIIALTIISIIASIGTPRVSQPLSYYDFADQRQLTLKIPNFFDVVSNTGFLVVGIIGIMVSFDKNTYFEDDRERWPYAVFFIGMILTSIGSSYFHLHPNTERLFWDRLPMTIAFMSLIAAQVADRISIDMGLVLLAPLLFIGAASVVYWLKTERKGVGNVVPYAILQGYAVIVLLLITWLYPSRYTRGNDLYLVFIAYALAKALETFDKGVFTVGQHILSGHTLKHIAATVAGGIVIRMLHLRRKQVK